MDKTEDITLTGPNGVQKYNKDFTEDAGGLGSSGEISATESTTNVALLESSNYSLNESTPDPELGGESETSFNPSEVAQPPAVISTGQLLPEGQVTFRAHLASMWYLVVIIIAPFIFLPAIFLVDDEFQRPARCGYTIAVMAVYWTTECMPIAITSLLPVVLLPALGVLSARNTAAAYFNDTSMLFVGGLLVAIAIEVWNVHQRIALLVLRVVGAEPRCLLLGITIVTWFLSMWISNTATTAMMMTIVQALMAQFRAIQDQKTIQPDTAAEASSSNGTHKYVINEDAENVDKTRVKKQPLGPDAELTRLGKALSLTVAYAANIGGIASLTGTGPNLVLFAAAQKTFEDVGLQSPITFGTWMVYGLPLSLLLVFIMWLWMVLVFVRCRSGCSCCIKSSDGELQKVNNMIKEEYRKLGPITYAQGTVLVTFVTLVVAWITRDLGGVGGWKVWFPEGFVSDSTPSLLFGILMFVLPASFPAVSLFRRSRSTASYVTVKPLLTWKNIHEKMPWSLYLLLGGGYALARAATDSGLSVWLGAQLMVFRDLNPWAILLIVCYIITFATEVTSNTAIATLMMPILSEMAINLRFNPLFLMFPGAITTSFAFMLPVATPPNAIVFSHGTLRVIDMVISGFFLNCISVPILLLATATWGDAFFHFQDIPAEFLRNVTKAKIHIPKDKEQGPTNERAQQGPNSRGFSQTKEPRSVQLCSSCLHAAQSSYYSSGHIPPQTNQHTVDHGYPEYTQHSSVLVTFRHRRIN